MSHAMHCLGIALFSVVLLSCYSTPTVHFYTDAVAEEDIEKIADVLRINGYEVSLNDRIIPEVFSKSTIVHPLIVQDYSVVNGLAEILNASGHPVDEISDLIVGKHIYTTSNIGLYLIEVPRRTKENTVSQDGGMPSRNDLSGLYDGLCGDDEGQLSLYGNGTAIFEFWKWSDKIGSAENVMFDGSWDYSDERLRVNFFDAGPVEFDIVEFEREVVDYGSYTGIKLERIQQTEPVITCDFIIEAAS